MHMLRYVTRLGGVNVHVNLRHTHMLRYVTGLGGVNVHVNLRHMHMLRYVTGLGGLLTTGLGFPLLATIKVRHTMQSLDQNQRPC